MNAAVCCPCQQYKAEAVVLYPGGRSSLFILPAFQFGNSFYEHARKDPKIERHFLHFASYKFLHLGYRPVGFGELSFVVTI
jgi:hypothetical protein